MKANQASFSVSKMVSVLGVSRSGFYAWRDRKPSRRSRQDAILTERVKTYHNASKKTYGAPRIHADLLDEGIRVSRKRVERLMKAAGLRGASKRKYVTTTVRDKRHRLSADLVDRNFYADEPNVLWGERMRHWFEHARTTLSTFQPGQALFIWRLCWMPSVVGLSTGQLDMSRRRISF